MPRGPTSKIINRKYNILNIVRRHREITARDLMEMMGLSRTQALYVLRMLEKEGYVRGVKRGQIIFWRVLH
ncbi:MAG: winged helix-turn-helix domain-containing protein [Thermoproteus sp.]|nr:winged helix-turn-helix domain-containing protein [Thermoproteus sp.]